jgi:hypothetical protein
LPAFPALAALVRGWSMTTWPLSCMGNAYWNSVLNHYCSLGMKDLTVLLVYIGIYSNIVKTHIVHFLSVTSLYVAPEKFVTYVLYSMVSIRRHVLLNFLYWIYHKKSLSNTLKLLRASVHEHQGNLDFCL